MNETMVLEDFRTKFNYDVSLANNLGKRDEQQDSVYLAVNDKEVLSVLSDGMGGLKNGRLASITAVRSFLENCEINKSDSWMADALAAADEVVSRMNSEKSNPDAGATLVAIYILDNYIQWVSAGDSRLYLYRENELLQITSDHNYFFELNHKISAGEMTRLEYEAEAPYGEQLLSFVGMGGLGLMDVSKAPFQLKKDDIVFICSDGIYKTITAEAMRTVFLEGKNAEEMRDRLVRYVEDANEYFQDNYSFAIIRIVN